MTLNKGLEPAETTKFDWIVISTLTSEEETLGVRNEMTVQRPESPLQLLHTFFKLGLSHFSLDEKNSELVGREQPIQELAPGTHCMSHLQREKRLSDSVPCVKKMIPTSHN